MALDKYDHELQVGDIVFIRARVVAAPRNLVGEYCEIELITNEPAYPLTQSYRAMTMNSREVYKQLLDFF